MPAHKEIEPLSNKEIAIILYFISRGAPYAVASEVIKLRCGTERDIQTCGDGTSFIREQLQKQRVQKSYEHTVVDFYLSNLEIEWTELRALLTLDADVQAIMAKYV